MVGPGVRRALDGVLPRTLAATLDERQAQWLGLARSHDPLALDWLLANFAPPRGELAMDRIDVLAHWPDDPRVVTGLLELCRTKPLVTYRPLWTRIFRQLRQRLALHVAPLIGELSAARPTTIFDFELAPRLRQLAAQLALMRPPIPPDPAIVAALDAKLAAGRDRAAAQTTDDFLREIWAAPADDGPRLVFADWLTERGDPRGEFISIQLVRHAAPDRASLARARALLAKHGRSWMGVLEPVIVRNAFVGWERGFVYRCEVAWRRLAAAPMLMTHPAWATVREYRLVPDGERACDPWLEHMIALRARRL